jgi:hypothetical protein
VSIAISVDLGKLAHVHRLIALRYELQDLPPLNDLDGGRVALFPCALLNALVEPHMRCPVLSHLCTSVHTKTTAEDNVWKRRFAIIAE